MPITLDTPIVYTLLLIKIDVIICGSDFEGTSPVRTSKVGSSLDASQSMSQGTTTLVSSALMHVPYAFCAGTNRVACLVDNPRAVEDDPNHLNVITSIPRCFNTDAWSHHNEEPKHNPPNTPITTTNTQVHPCPAHKPSLLIVECVLTFVPLHNQQRTHIEWTSISQRSLVFASESGLIF